MAPGQTRQQIGYITIHSGQIFIIDPCYMDNWKFDEYREQQAGDCGWVDVFMRVNNDAELDNGERITGIANGRFPVYVIVDENRDGQAVVAEIMLTEAGTGAKDGQAEPIAAEREDAGMVGVDSGQIFITDPCNLNKWQPGVYLGKVANSYDRVTRMQVAEQYSEVENGVVIGNFGGDGGYDVYSSRDASGQVVKIEVVFYEPDDEAE